MKDIERALCTYGFMFEPELEWLRDRAKELPEGGTWVEIGVLCGRSLLAVSVGLPERATLMAIDIELGTAAIEGDSYCKAYTEIWKARPDLRLIGIRCPSAEAAKYVSDGSADVVFVDADHTYEGVRADIQAWLPKLKAGGMLCGHDYHPQNWPGVVQAVSEVLPAAAPVGVGSLWSFRSASAKSPL